jgi:hypothetical protein
MHHPPTEDELEQLAQSLVIFGRAHGQLAYAIELYDEYKDKVVRAYHGGRYGHPYTKIAEDKIVLELTVCLDEYAEYYRPLVGDDQPVEAREFFRTLAAEEESLRRIRSQVTSTPRGDLATRHGEIRALLHTLPSGLRYWRERAREALVVLDAIWRHHARSDWFPRLRERALELSASAQFGGEPSEN